MTPPHRGPATEPIADEVGETRLREWYRPMDLLLGGIETVIPATSSLSGTIDLVMNSSGLAALAEAQATG
ncbi:hypothetical protein ABZV31_32330 [Streptomyces sp. NPDC005202]|uniref:hypothetical protein n=1 Tax=Streptomyces sp. NPDC005202 TaxID=3157021 RepID=UPI0033BE940F